MNKPLLKHLLGGTLKLQDTGWTILTNRWIGFFIALAILNEISLENTINRHLG